MVEMAKEEITEKNDSANVNEPLKTKPFIILVACCAALGGLIFGYDIGGAGATFVMNGEFIMFQQKCLVMNKNTYCTALTLISTLGFQVHFDWSCAPDDVGCIPKTISEINLEKGLINAFFGIGATIGALINPYFADTKGRHFTLIICNFVFILGASMQAAAPNMNVMWIGRIFSGMGIGMLSMVVPVYISECSPEHMRGRLGTLWQIAVTLGILVASACNVGLQNWNEGWRISYGGNIVFSLMLLFALIFMPESPRWLAANSSEEELIKALKKTRYEHEIEHEMEELRLETEEEKRMGNASWTELLTSDNRMLYRVVLGMSLQLFQQLCGINAIMFYAPDILNTFFTQDQAVVGTFVLNIINFLSTFITVWAVDRFGRVKLLTSGGIIMCAALISNAILSAQTQTIAIGYLVVVFSAIFIVGFAYSWGPVVWVVCSEMFPLRHRGKATGLTTSTNWIATTLVGALFPAASTASLSGCFIFFALMIALGVVTVHLFEVETANKTILEIDDAFAKHKPQLRRWRNVNEREIQNLSSGAGVVDNEKKSDITSVPPFDIEDGTANPSH